MSTDPAAAAPIVPVYDDFALPHVLTHSAVVTGGLRNYLAERWDEALRDNRDNALAMFRDGWIQAMLRERIRGTAGLKWHLEPDDARDPHQQHAAEIVTAAIKRTPRLRRFLRQLLLAIWYGRCANQVIWDWQPVNGQRALVVKKWLPIDGDKLVFTHAHEPIVLVHAGETNRLPRSEIVTTDRGLGLLLKGSWRQRFLLHTADPADSDFFAGEQASSIHGVGLRHWSYWLWFLRDEYLSWITDQLERTGLGLVVMLYEQGNTEAEAAMEKVAKDYSRRSIVKIPVPPGMMQARTGGRANGIEIVETPTAGIEILDKLRIRLEDQMERLFIGQSMSSGKDDEDGLGGSGRAKFAEATKRDIIRDDADDLAESNTGSDHEPGLVSMIFRWTLPQYYGKFGLRWMFDLEEVDTEKRMEAVLKAFQVGVDFKKDEVRELTGLSKPEEQDETVSQQAQQEEQAQLQQQGQMQQMQAQQGHEQAQGQQAHQQQLEQADQQHRQGLEKLSAEQQHEQAMQPAAASPSAPAPPGWTLSYGPRGGNHWHSPSGKVYRGTYPPGHDPDSHELLTGLLGGSSQQYARDEGLFQYGSEDWSGPHTGKMGGTYWINIATQKKLYSHDNPGAKGDAHKAKLQEAHKQKVGEATKPEPSAAAPDAAADKEQQPAEEKQAPTPDTEQAPTASHATPAQQIAALHQKMLADPNSVQPHEVQAAISALAGLSVAEIHALKKQLGQRAGGKKSQLVDKLAYKLFGARGIHGDLEGGNTALVSARLHQVQSAVDAALAKGATPAQALQPLSDQLQRLSIFDLFKLRKQLALKHPGTKKGLVQALVGAVGGGAGGSAAAPAATGGGSAGSLDALTDKALKAVLKNVVPGGWTPEAIANNFSLIAMQQALKELGQPNALSGDDYYEQKWQAAKALIDHVSGKSAATGTPSPSGPGPGEAAPGAAEAGPMAGGAVDVTSLPVNHNVQQAAAQAATQNNANILINGTSWDEFTKIAQHLGLPLAPTDNTWAAWSKAKADAAPAILAKLKGEPIPAAATAPGAPGTGSPTTPAFDKPALDAHVSQLMGEGKGMSAQDVNDLASKLKGMGVLELQNATTAWGVDVGQPKTKAEWAASLALEIGAQVNDNAKDLAAGKDRTVGAAPAAADAASPNAVPVAEVDIDSLPVSEEAKGVVKQAKQAGDLKQFENMPFVELEKLADYLGVPYPASTPHGITDDQFNELVPKLAAKLGIGTAAGKAPAAAPAPPVAPAGPVDLAAAGLPPFVQHVLEKVQGGDASYEQLHHNLTKLEMLGALQKLGHPLGSLDPAHVPLIAAETALLETVKKGGKPAAATATPAATPAPTAATSATPAAPTPAAPAAPADPAAVVADYPDVVSLYKPAIGAEKFSIAVPKDSDLGKAIAALGGTFKESAGKWGLAQDKAGALADLLQQHGYGFPKPEELSSLSSVQALGGSTGAKLVQDAKGKQYVQKSGASPAHVQSEHAADSAYQALGIAVPKGKLYDEDGKPVKLAEYIAGGKTLGEYLGSASAADKQKVLAEIQKGFVADALLGNWDVIGQGSDNVLVSPDGKVWRIDNGGSLAYRAQGGKKTAEQWGSDSVPELASMRSASINPSAAKIFGGITDDQVKEQVGALVKNRDKLLAALPADQRATVGKRLDWLVQHYPPPLADLPYTTSGGKTLTSAMKAKPLAGTPPATGKGKTWTAAPAEAAQVAPLADNAPRAQGQAGFNSSTAPPSFLEHAKKGKKATPKEAIAQAKHFTNGGYDSLVKAMQECPETLDCLSSSQKEQADGIDEAIAKQGVLETPITVWRQFHVGDADAFHDWMSAAAGLGETIQIPGHKSTATEPGHWHGNVALEIRARTGIYAAPFSHHKTEQEWLMSHHAKFKVVGVKEVPWGHSGGTKKVVQLEEVV
jgi:hypothetical protein